MALTGVNTSDNTEAVKIIYTRDFLTPFEDVLRINKVAQRKKVPIESNVGDTIEFTRFLQLPDITAALSDEMTPPSIATMKTQTLQATIDVWANATRVSEKYDFTTIDAGLREQSRIFGMQAGNSFERDVATVWGQYGGIPMRAGGGSNSAYEKHGLILVTGATTTALSCASLTEADDYWNGARGVFTDPTKKGYGESFLVTDFANSGAALTVTGLTTAPEAGQTFSLAKPVGLTSANVFSNVDVRRARAMLQWQLVPTFNGQNYVGLFDPDVEIDFFNDPQIDKLLVYHASSPSGLFTGQAPTVWGIEWQVGTKLFRAADDTPTTLSYTGNVHSVGIFGKNCLGVIDPRGHGLKIGMTPKEVAEPIAHLYSNMHWKAYRQAKVINPTCSVNLMVGSSAQAA